jgi:hypothetical protein
MWGKMCARGGKGGTVSKDKEDDDSDEVKSAACGIDNQRRGMIDRWDEAWYTCCIDSLPSALQIDSAGDFLYQHRGEPLRSAGE